MTWVHELRTFSAAGVAQYRVTDYNWLACTIRVNAPGMLSVGLPTAAPDDPVLDAKCKSVISSLEHRSHVELWRKNEDLGIDWYRHFGGLYLKQNRKLAEVERFTLYAPGYPWLLGTRVIDWFADTASRTAFVSAKAETIMKTLVNYNAAAAATIANGRKREGAITGVTAVADSAAGNTLDWYCFGDNLLETLQKLAKVAGGDFDLVKTATNAFEFRWYTGQLGTDRTTTVKFAVELGNMGSPEYNYDRLDERTAACVWGEGKATSRAYVTRTGPDYAAGNNVEMFVNASDVNTTAGLNARGDQKLDDTRAREELSFDILQTPACMFGLHYYLGDLVTVQNPFTGASFTAQINAVTIGLQEGGEVNTTVEVATP
jgi:hypothetical protein